MKHVHTDSRQFSDPRLQLGNFTRKTSSWSYSDVEFFVEVYKLHICVPTQCSPSRTSGGGMTRQGERPAVGTGAGRKRREKPPGFRSNKSISCNLIAHTNLTLSILASIQNSPHSSVSFNLMEAELASMLRLTRKF